MRNRYVYLFVIGIISFLFILTACQPTQESGEVEVLVVKKFSGRVWSDDNGNGIQDDDEAGIKNVAIRFERVDSQDSSSLNTKTDDNGNYVLEVRVPKGSKWWVIVERKDGFFFTKANIGDDKIDSDVDQSGGAKYVDETIDAGYLKNYVVSGIVYLDYDPDGLFTEGLDERMEGVEVLLFDYKTFEELQRTRTTTDGSFIFSVSSENPVLVQVVHPNDDLAFAPVTDGEIIEYPSRVDPEGLSEENFMYRQQEQFVNAALQYPLETDQPPETTGDETPPEEPGIFFVEGIVFYDKDVDSLFDVDAGDDFMYDVQVELIDDVTQELLQTTTTGDTGAYSFEIEKQDNPVRIKVLNTDEGLQFSPPTEGGLLRDPSSVDDSGLSVEVFDFSTGSVRINAGLFGPRFALVEPTGPFPFICAPGEKTDILPISDILIDLTEDDDIFIQVGGIEFTDDDPIFIGLDATGPGLPVTAQNPEFALGGAAAGWSAALVNGAVAGTAAVQATEDGDVNISTGAQVAVEGGQASMIVSGSEFQAGLDRFRVTVKVGDICVTKGDPAVNDAFELAADISPEMAQFLASRDGVPVCDNVNSTCVKFSKDWDFVRTGDQTVDLTIDGKTYSVQFIPSAGDAEGRRKNFTDINWVLVDYGTLDTELRVWQIAVLNANGEPYGVLVTDDNGSSTNPTAFSISITSSVPLSEAELERLIEVIQILAPSFRSAFEIAN
jgi:hypothetical protein